MVQILSTDEVQNNITALVKWLYNKLFNWIVLKINQSHEANQIRSHDNDLNFIGILDIFGFEVLGTNSFEQLCITFTNERLQQVRYILVLVHSFHNARLLKIAIQ